MVEGQGRPFFLLFGLMPAVRQAAKRKRKQKKYKDLLAPEVTLDAKQMTAYAKIVEGKNVALLGPAGTGKSAIVGNAYRHLLYDVHNMDKRRVVLTASTGVAALNYVNGITLNSWSLGFTLEEDGSNSGKWTEEPYVSRYGLILAAKTLFVDEISMVSGPALTELNKMLQYIRGNSRVFGGLQLVVVGDFYQLPPTKVYPEGHKYAGEPMYAFQTQVWKDAFGSNTIILSKLYRQAGDAQFQDLLARMRTVEGLTEEDCVLLRMHTDIGGVVEATAAPDDTRKYLYGYREDVNLFNSKRMEQVVGEESHEYNARFAKVVVTRDADGGVERREVEERWVSKEVLKCFQARLKLVLKVGVRVMLKYNLNIKKKLCNGSEGTIVRFVAVLTSGGGVVPVTTPPCVVAGMVAAGDARMLPMVRFDGVVDEVIVELHRMKKRYCGVEYVYEMMPLVEGWASTVHMYQGKQCESLYVGGGMWAKGMFYTAVTRVKRLDGLMLRNFRKEDVKMDLDVVGKFYARLN